MFKNISIKPLILGVLGLACSYKYYNSNTQHNLWTADASLVPVLECLQVDKDIPHQPTAEEKLDYHIQEIYQSCQLEQKKLSFEVFRTAMVGYYNLQKKYTLKKSHIFSIVDYDQPSTHKRMYVLDLQQTKLLKHLLVAHGQETGWKYATDFSNRPQSHQSSLGFYKTAETYGGKYGYSLRLDGLEPGFNHKARSRAIVVHGADYVSQDFITKHGRLGRSWGCLTLTLEESKPVIDIIKGGSYIYVHKTQKHYLQASKYLKPEKAIEFLAGQAREAI